MTPDKGTALVERRPPQAGAATWTNLVDGPAAARSRPHPPSLGRVVGRFVVANLVAVTLLMAGSVWASQEAAQNEAIADARHTTDLLATLLVVPNLQDGLTAGDPEAVAALDEVLRDRVAAADVIRVKIWTPDGDIVYSDQPRLIGENFPLGDDDLAALQDGVTRAELSDLSRPENQFERSAGRLLEVYRAIRTPGG
jgi:two-component system, NarL family, sensor kinase